MEAFGMTDSKRSGNSSLRSKLRGIKPVAIEIWLLHPNGAVKVFPECSRPPAPFVDFMLSKSGQEIMASQGRWVRRKDVKYLVDPGQKKLQVVSYEKWGDRTNELVQTYNKLIMREGH